MDWAANGCGILVSTPLPEATEYLAKGRLMPVLPHWALCNNQVYAYATKKDYRDPTSLISVFLTTLKETSDRVWEDAQKVWAECSEVSV